MSMIGSVRSSPSARTVYTAVIDPYPLLPTPALSISRGKRAKTDGG